MGTTEGSASSNGSGGVATAKSSTLVGAAAVSPFRGRRVKRFRLVDELGRGAMGRVFLAEDTVLKRHVALKLLPTKHRDGTPNHRTERLIREARSAANLEHPNAVTVFEIDESAGVHYIAMELVEGGNLEKLVHMSGPMEVERACQLIAEAAEVLGHAHERGIVHRDVKPANLLLTRNGRCKVTDFGLALFDDASDTSDLQKRCVGTPHFIAPEVAQGMGATAASDIYGLGCTLYFLLTGRPPYSGRSPAALLEAHIRQPLPDVRETRADVSDRLAKTIAQACAKDPADRFESAERFAKLLRTFTIATGSSNSLAGLRVADSPSPSSSMHLAPVAPPLDDAPASVGGWNIKISRINLPQPAIWAGIGVIATALLIGLGMLISNMRGSSRDADALKATLPQRNVTKPAAPVAPAPSAVAETADTQNVVKNGNMEQSSPQGLSVGWFIHDKYKDVISVEEEDGNRFIRLTSNDATKTYFADQQIPVDPDWKVVNVSARMRATGFHSGKQPFQDARLAFAFRDAKGVRVGNWPPVPALKEDTNWVEKVVTVDVPPGAKTMYLQLAVFNATGTVDFDDVKVIPQKVE
ncbi:MAG TPA: serine/threonine-protein kinase [Tepidisphaeraceae bacterium]|jgi:serine/threonine-protein kinase